MTDNMTAMNNTPQELEAIMTILGADYLSGDSVLESSKAWIAPVVYDDDGNPCVVTDVRQYHGDVYDLLAGKQVSRMTKDYDNLLLYTCGWAAPVGENDEIPPSLHPDRIRVGLLCLTTRNGLIGSAMRKGDDNEIIVTTEGQGLLAEAMSAVWE